MSEVTEQTDDRLPGDDPRGARLRALLEQLWRAHQFVEAIEGCAGRLPDSAIEYCASVAEGECREALDIAENLTRLSAIFVNRE